MCFDVRTRKIRNFAFINFLVRSQAEHFHESQLEFRNEFLTCMLSEKIQLLLDLVDLTLLSRRNHVWNDDFKQANQLCKTVPRPPLSPEPANPRPAIRLAPRHRPPAAIPIVEAAQAAPAAPAPRRRPPKRRDPVEAEDGHPKRIKIESVVVFPAPPINRMALESDDEEVLDLGMNGMVLE
jgi:hypothetical protein